MLWRSIADDFEQKIRLGTHAKGTRLPAETEIAARYGVNRHTIRRAIAELAERGLVYSARGSGTYVKADRLDYRIGTRTRFSEIVAAAGYEAEGKLLAHEIAPASVEIAERLALQPGEAVIRLEIVRSANRVPISAATTWLSAERYPDTAKIFRQTRSITRALEHYGVKNYRRKWTRIGASFADAVDALHLQLSAHRPILIVDSLDVAARSGQPVLTTHARFAADRVALSVEC